MTALTANHTISRQHLAVDALGVALARTATVVVAVIVQVAVVVALTGVASPAAPAGQAPLRQPVPVAAPALPTSPNLDDPAVAPAPAPAPR